MEGLDIMNRYSDNVTFSANVINNMYSVEFDKLAVNQDVCTISAKTDADAEKDFGEGLFAVDAEFGAVLSIASSGSADTKKVTVYGFDYLGQPVVEEVARNNQTAVETKKAFKYIRKIVAEKGVEATVTVKRGLKLGLPYHTTKIVAEIRDGVDSSTTKLVAAVNTKGTISSGDPRGLANLGTYSSPANIKLVCMTGANIFTIDGKQHGGLFGVPHFAG